jgi:hypothetical protein
MGNFDYRREEESVCTLPRRVSGGDENAVAKIKNCHHDDRFSGRRRDMHSEPNSRSFVGLKSSS